MLAVVYVITVASFCGKKYKVHVPYSAGVGVIDGYAGVPVGAISRPPVKTAALV